MATSRLSIRIRPRLRQELRGLSSATGRRESQVVREALEEYINSNGKRETCFGIAHRSGLIGAIKGAPRDLSTHPRHLRGFGR